MANYNFDGWTKKELIGEYSTHKSGRLEKAI